MSSDVGLNIDHLTAVSNQYDVCGRAVFSHVKEKLFLQEKNDNIGVNTFCKSVCELSV